MTRSGARITIVSVACTLVLTLGACGGSSGTHQAGTAASVATSTTKTSTTKSTATTSTTLEKAKPYDPSKPIDLGGTPGVTPAEQHRAEKLVRDTIVDLRKYTFPAAAVADGYRSIGDALTGDEHFVKWADVDDGHILDPTRPESLVYEVRNGTQQIAAAMYMLPFS